MRFRFKHSIIFSKSVIYYNNKKFTVKQKHIKPQGNVLGRRKNTNPTSGHAQKTAIVLFHYIHEEHVEEQKHTVEKGGAT